MSRVVIRGLTVIIRDDSPMIFANDGPTYRRVTFKLTEEQAELLKVRKVGEHCGTSMWESISKIIWEEENE